MDQINLLAGSEQLGLISTNTALLNIVLGAIVASVISLVYDKYERGTANNPSLSKNFLTLTVVTIFIISVVKSSLSLSLGLVGALSIIRFRTAIKEPSELIYLFLCVAIGLGFGANRPVYTILASSFIILILIVKGKIHSRSKSISNNIFLEVEMTNNTINLDNIMKEIRKHAKEPLLIRHEYGKDKNLILIKANFSNTKGIDNLKSSNWFKEDVISFSLFEDKGIF